MSGSTPPNTENDYFRMPNKTRKCTDSLFIACYLTVILVWCGIFCYYYSTEKLKEVTTPIDSVGKICANNTPYLFTFDWSQCRNNHCYTPQICVENCPVTSWTEDDFKRSLASKDYKRLQQDMICIDDYNKLNIINDEIAEFALKQGYCAKSYAPSEPVHGRCIPITAGKDVQHRSFDKTGSLELNIVADLLNSSKGIIDILLFALICCLSVCLLITCNASIVIRNSVWILFPVIVSVILYSLFQGLKGNSTSYMLYFHQAVFVIICLVVFRDRKYVKDAIQIIEVATKALQAVSNTLPFLLIPCALYMVAFMASIYMSTSLYSTESPQFKANGLSNASCVCRESAEPYRNGDTCDPYKFRWFCSSPTSAGVCISAGCFFERIEQSSVIYLMQIYNICVLFWSVNLIINFGQMVLARSFVKWYWHDQYKKNSILSNTTATLYHIGTLALASFVIPIVAVFNFPNTSLVSMFGNKNVLIQSTLQGKPLLQSGKYLSDLIKEFSPIDLLKAKDVAVQFLHLLRILLSYLMAAITYAIYTNVNEPLNNNIIPSVMVGIGTYGISAIFIDVYAIIIDTSFICYLNDLKENRGKQINCMSIIFNQIYQVNLEMDEVDISHCGRESQ